MIVGVDAAPFVFPVKVTVVEDPTEGNGAPGTVQVRRRRYLLDASAARALAVTTVFPFKRQRGDTSSTWRLRGVMRLFFAPEGLGLRTASSALEPAEALWQGDARAVADDRLLTLVFRNLLENACRYAEEETAIRVTGRVEGDDVVIRVVDDGVLIPADDLPRIFERFYQVERHRGQNSTGLGLAICKHVIERHGGRIWAESPAEDGSTAIIFTLRRADAPRTPVQE